MILLFNPERVDEYSDDQILELYRVEGLGAQYGQFVVDVHRGKYPDLIVD